MSETTVNMNWTGLFNTLLLVLFIALKLTGVIAWSWWWVLSPLWIPICVALIVGLVALAFCAAFLR